MKLIGKWLVAILLILTAFLVSTYKWQIPEYTYDQSETFANFDEYYQKELEISKKEQTRPDNEEKLVRYSDEKTPLAILYVHGFGASRVEGEDMINQVAETFQSNLYYVRLPGHGTNVEDHKNTQFPKYLQDAETALLMSTQLGEKVVLVGTSMGGLISTYLAAKHPDKVAAVILASPFYDFTTADSNVFRFSWGVSFIHMLLGEIRKSAEQDSKNESYNYWYRNQYYDAIQHIMNLKRFIEKEDSLSKIEDPILMFYFYKSEAIQDRSASVKAMLTSFDKIQHNGKASPLNRAVKVEEGDHVLFSRFAKVDKPLLYKEMVDFITKTTGVEPAKPSSKKVKR
ncbi:MAG: alpha/beta fold hydrolase [Leptospira sp.]|nr:alpha/beta fold hydrolase [Leptospira sp.]